MSKMANFNFPINTRVKLRDVSPEFYDGFGCVGNEGWIRAQKVDEFGYPHIYVVWDKAHWAYNGAPDKWTWEGHFDKVESMDDNQQDMKKVMMETFIEAFQETLNKMSPDADKSDQAKEPAVDPKNEENVDKVAALSSASKILDDAESFVVIAVKRTQDPLTPNGMLDIEVARYAGSNDSAHMIDLQMANFGIAAYEQLAIDTIQEEYHKS